MGHEIVICGSCREGDAALIAALVVPVGFTLRRVECMSLCGEPTAVAFRAPGKATYLFAGLHAGDCDDIHGFAALYSAAPGGWIEDARAAGRLRLCLKGRVPA